MGLWDWLKSLFTPRPIVRDVAGMMSDAVGDDATSPAICNAILKRLDLRLAGLARKHGFAYTRYADDLTFSGPDVAKIKLIITIATRIAREEGMPLNPEKTRVLREGRRQTVTGVIVNKTAGLSRQQRRRVRTALHQQRKAQAPDPAKDQYLKGKLAYIRLLNPTQASVLAKLAK